MIVAVVVGCNNQNIYSCYRVVIFELLCLTLCRVIIEPLSCCNMEPLFSYVSITLFRLYYLNMFVI